MARPKKYGRFELTEREIEGLTTITNTRTAEAQKVQRAKILLLSAAGMSNVLMEASNTVWIRGCSQTVTVEHGGPKYCH
jgi:hypothetical protein